MLSRLGAFVLVFRSSLPPGVVFGLFGLVPVGAPWFWFGSGLAGRPGLLGVCRCSALLSRPSSLLVSPCPFKSLAFELVLCTGASPHFGTRLVRLGVGGEGPRWEPVVRKRENEVVPRS